MKVFKSSGGISGKDLYFLYLEDEGDYDNDVARQLDLRLDIYRKMLSKFNGHMEPDFAFDFIFFNIDECKICKRFIEQFIE